MFNHSRWNTTINVMYKTGKKIFFLKKSLPDQKPCDIRNLVMLKGAESIVVDKNLLKSVYIYRKI